MEESFQESFQEPPKRSSALVDKYANPDTGLMAEWYVGFILSREMTCAEKVLHCAEDRDLFRAEFHQDALMELAISSGWIKDYFLVFTRRTYPCQIKTVRLQMPEGVDRTFWKRLLGNRGYDNLHLFARRLANRPGEELSTRPTPPPRGNTYYGKKYRPGGARHPDSPQKEHKFNMRTNVQL